MIALATFTIHIDYYPIELVHSEVRYKVKKKNHINRYTDIMCINLWLDDKMNASEALKSTHCFSFIRSHNLISLFSHCQLFIHRNHLSWVKYRSYNVYEQYTSMIGISSNTLGWLDQSRTCYVAPGERERNQYIYLTNFSSLRYKMLTKSLY